jgi:hypothetical protein
MNQNDMIAAIGKLFPTSTFGADYTFTDSLSIRTWNNSLGEQPAIEQIQTALDSIQLSGYKQQQAAKIEASYQNAAFNTSIPYMGTTFWTDQSSQSMLTGALVVLGKSGVPDGFMWGDATGVGVPMTLADLDGLGAAILGRMNTDFWKHKTLQAQIDAATTIAEVQAIVW